jgi:peptide-methionine (S)-S-oxide reductase
MTVMERRSLRISSVAPHAAAAAGAAILMAALFLQAPGKGHAESAVVVPPPAMGAAEAVDATSGRAVLAGGCFWGMQAVFQHVKGVRNAVSGYAGGPGQLAQYEMVGTGTTGHAESVEITFDPKIVSYGTLLQIYFSVAHDPTELNRQGPDEGTQYRSTIFAANDAQRRIAQDYIKQLDKAHIYGAPIATTIELSKTFYPAETYHQDYATLHPDSGYIATYDLPKVENLKRYFPNLYRPEPKLVADTPAVN